MIVQEYTMFRVFRQQMKLCFVIKDGRGKRCYFHSASSTDPNTLDKLIVFALLSFFISLLKMLFLHTNFQSLLSQ